MTGLDDDLLQRRLRHVDVRQDRESRSVWVEMKYAGRPCFTVELVEDIRVVQRAIQQSVRADYEQGRSDRLLFQVLASTDARAFNLDGDLPHFIRLIESGDRDGLQEYARTCVDIQYASVTHYGVPFTTIGLVQGEALGGGFEAALSNNVLIAERSARFGFPEMTFGMFPGMGALSLLTRKIAPAAARRLIMDHRIYSAEELYEMGVIDVLCADGEGRDATFDYIYRHTLRAPGLHGFQAAVDRVLPVCHDELSDVVDHWVDAALQLSGKNRRLMGYLARAQETRQGGAADDVSAEDASPSSQ